MLKNVFVPLCLLAASGTASSSSGPFVHESPAKAMPVKKRTKGDSDDDIEIIEELTTPIKKLNLQPKQRAKPPKVPESVKSAWAFAKACREYEETPEGQAARAQYNWDCDLEKYDKSFYDISGAKTNTMNSAKVDMNM